MCVALVFAVVMVSGCNEATVEAITITSANGATEIEAGKTLKLSATVTPSKASQEVTWSSGDTSKATVDSNGLVTAIAEGNVTVTATSVANNKISKTFALIILASKATDNTPKTVSLSTANNVTTVKVNETLKVNATVSPATASQEVVWATSDSTIATVSNGVVTGVKAGDVVITATAKDVSTVKNSINIKVTNEEVKDPTADYASMPFSTHAQYVSASKGDLLKIKGVVTYIAPEVEGTVNYYLQNGEEGFYIYKQSTADFPVELGQTYAVGGAKDNYQGQLELKTIEYCVKLSEACTFTPVSLTGKDVSSVDDMNAYQGAVVTGTATVKTAPSVSTTKAYNISVTIGDKETSLRIDPANMSSTEFAAINDKASDLIGGSEIDFVGVMSAFGWGKPKTQIHIYKASELTVNEASPADKVDLVKNALIVSAFVKASDNTIALQSGVTAVPDVTVTWASSNTDIITSAGAVTHPTNDTTVTLTATITHNTDATATDTRTFKVNVAGSAFAGQKLAGLDFEDADATPENLTYGVSPTKKSYTLKDSSGNVTDEANTVELGGKKWILTGTLISTAAGNDHCDGQLAGRMSSKEGKVQTTVADEYNYVQFDVAIYNNQTLGSCIKVMYQMAGSDAWVESDFIVTVNSYSLTTYRIALAQGAKNVKICVVSGAGNVNIDNIELYK